MDVAFAFQQVLFEVYVTSTWLTGNVTEETAWQDVHSAEHCIAELAAKLWAQARNAGTPTASIESLDVDVILAAQSLLLGVPTSSFIFATTNVGHLSQFVPADLWTNIKP